MTSLLLDPGAWASLFGITLIQIALGADNLIIITIIANKLPGGERTKAIRWGLILAMAFRIVLLFGVSLILTAATASLFELDTRVLPWAEVTGDVNGKALVLVVGGAGLVVEYPELRGFNFRGGATVSPEFVAVLVSLAIYQSGFAAETIRSGILGVRKGQIEAARSLGLPPRLVLSKVVLPQAMRIVVPPMTGQYMSLTKNSSLAVVIGYPELVRVSTAVISETGRAIECITILMSIYLTLSLLTSAFMNWYNRRVAFVEQ